MKFKGIRIYIVLASIAATLAVLLTIQFIHQKYNIEKPLFKLYSQTKLVKGVKIQEKEKTVKVILEVEKTENLRNAYRELTSYTEQVMGNTEFDIELRDNRTRELEEAYYQSQFVIYEALAKGDFTKMADVIRLNAEKVGAQARVFIDRDYIYVQFVKGKHYLYEIVPRDHAVRETVADRTGSELR